MLPKGDMSATAAFDSDRYGSELTFPQPLQPDFLRLFINTVVVAAFVLHLPCHGVLLQ